MDPTPRSEDRIARYLPPLLLAALILLAMGGVIRNEWVQDDTGIISQNTLVHTISGVWRAWSLPYWPVAERAELYRPLGIALFTLQWVIGDGAPWVFRIVNLLAYGAAVWGVWAILKRIAPAPAAWLGAALFAVHPVHVEAVAVSVNQGETMVAALLCWAAVRYLDWRRGLLDRRRAWGTIIFGFIVAIFIKEHAMILPGFFLALELTVLTDTRGWRERARAVAPLYLTLFVLAALFWTIRGQVLGAGSGTAPMETLKGLTFLGRAATMLGVVPEWIRLLVWPAHLQMEWSPLEYVPYSGWTLRETLGIVGLGSLLLALGLSWGRRPRITLALLWLAVALFPVSNLAIPTGVIIAERTLFLASVAVALIAADFLAFAAETPALQGRPVRSAISMGAGLLLGVGAIACAVRMVTWRDRILFLAAAVEDAPLSYRTNMSWGILLHERGEPAAGDSVIRRAFELHPNDVSPFTRLAKTLRQDDAACKPAATIYTLVLGQLPRRGDARTGFIACAVWLGDYAGARKAAMDGIALGIDADLLKSALPTIDSAASHNAPPGTVRLPHVTGAWFDVGLKPSTP